jgi:hypothetical protein
VWINVAVYLVAAGLIFAMLFLCWRGGRTYLRWRGMRLITCPETAEPAAVEVDANHAALSAGIGKFALQLKSCSRWPERQRCGQECLAEIEASPDGCLVRAILTKWYEAKSCVCCSSPLGNVDWLHKPALMSPEHITFEWDEVRAERVPEVLSTYLPVCWNCHIAETFRRLYPHLVTDRLRNSVDRTSKPTN